MLPSSNDDGAYEVARDFSDSNETSHSSLRQFASLIVQIFNGVVAFASKNDEPIHDDLLGDEPIDGESNPGIHYGDVRQGNLGDCYLAAAMIALARADYTRIQRMVHDFGDGSFTVTFPGGLPWPIFDNVLSNGYNQDWMSGDYDSVTGEAEAWPNLVEKAYAMNKGGSIDPSYAGIVNGFVGDAWDVLVGGSHNWSNIMGSDSTTTVASIQAAIAAGDQVAVTTPKGDKTVSTGTGLVSDHTYIVKTVSVVQGGVFVVLLNPWDPANPEFRRTIPAADINSVSDGVYRLTVPTGN